MGIDPGGSGGFALLGDKGPFAEKMPATERDTWELIEELAGLADIAVIEQVNGFSGQSASASFTFGRSYGFLRACLISSGVRFEAVSAAKWQKPFGLPTSKKAGSKTAKKNAHKARAQELWPGVKVTHALADALLIAEWRRRQWRIRC